MPLRLYPVLGSLVNGSPVSHSNSTPSALVKKVAELSQGRHDIRSYAQHASSKPENKTSMDEYEWPVCRRGDIPTPYEILKLNKGAPYSKALFYELVKVYHPDRTIHGSEHVNHVSQDIRLERYRLIVAAHEILSDTEKRRAYDKWGLGWDGQSHIPRQRSWSRSSHEGGPNFYGYRTSPAYNATWEDWERWYRRQDPKYQQQTRFTSNENFVGLIFLFMAIGASLELGRAIRLSNQFMEQVDARHTAISKGLAERRDSVSELSDQEARVQKFLKVRESGYHDHEPPVPPSPSVPKSLPPPGLTSGWK